MTEKKALRIAQKKFPKNQFAWVTEYKGMYVFTTNGDRIENPIAVEKETGKVLVFHPMLNDPQAYFKTAKEKGHEIKMDAYTAKVKSGEDAVDHALRMKGVKAL